MNGHHYNYVIATDDGVDWYRVDTGTLIDNHYLLDVAANQQGIVVASRDAVFTSPDGLQWKSSGFAARYVLQLVAAYDGGFVAVSSALRSDGEIHSILYSADGLEWTPLRLQVTDGKVFWNELAGDGTSLLAVGVAEDNVQGIWRWSP